MTPNPSLGKELDLLAGQKEAQREELTGTLEGQVAQLAQDTIAQFRHHLDALLEYRYTDIERQVREQIAAEVERAVDEARRAERRILAGELNQAVRRLRSVSTTEDVTRWLLDATSAFCDRAAVLAVHGRFLQGLCVRGVESVETLHLFDTLDVPLEEAPAFGQAADGQDPVVAIATRSEVSDAIHGVFEHRLGERVYLFPVVVRGETAAVLYVAPGSQSIDVAPLELVCQIAASVAETLVVEPPPASESPAGAAAPSLVQIDGWKPITDWKVTPPDWPSLAPEEQELHLQARRFARVHVAEMRLYRGDEVQEGRGARKLYLALKTEVDRARDAFRQKFLSASPTMVDYLHLELVRSLAHDKATLLGREYPGPLA